MTKTQIGIGQMDLQLISTIGLHLNQIIPEKKTVLNFTPTTQNGLQNPSGTKSTIITIVTKKFEHTLARSPLLHVDSNYLTSLK